MASGEVAAKVMLEILRCRQIKKKKCMWVYDWILRRRALGFQIMIPELDHHRHHQNQNFSTLLSWQVHSNIYFVLHITAFKSKSLLFVVKSASATFLKQRKAISCNLCSLDSTYTYDIHILLKTWLSFQGSNGKSFSHKFLTRFAEI